jgi:putative acyl-CoA dehydrogenase
VEESILPRLYREAPLYSIWEGSGNVMCLDVLRALTKDPATVETLLAEFQTTAGADQRLDEFAKNIGSRLATAADDRYAARDLTEKLALTLQATLMVRHSSPSMAEAFIGSRLAGHHGNAFGTLPDGVDEKGILNSVLEPLAMPK